MSAVIGVQGGGRADSTGHPEQNKTADLSAPIEEKAPGEQTADGLEEMLDFVPPKEIISNLPESPKTLLDQGWIDITPQAMKANSSSVLFKDGRSGLTVRFDRGIPGRNGYAGKDHYHILNPNTTGKQDRYLDRNGNPVPGRSKASHIIPLNTKGDGA